MEASFSTQEPKAINFLAVGRRKLEVGSGWWLGLSTIDCFKIPDQVGNDTLCSSQLKAASLALRISRLSSSSPSVIIRHLQFLYLN